jgi:penicillin-binding protein 1A
MYQSIRFQWNNLLNSIHVVQEGLDVNPISQTLVDLLIAAEDHRYGSHPGVDFVAMCRAIWRTMFCGRREGGSTIAMQLVRVLTGRYEKTLSRKVIEILLAVKLTRFLSDSELPSNANLKLTSKQGLC